MAPVAPPQFEIARNVLGYIVPENREDFRMVAVGIRSLGPMFEEVFVEWATRHAMRKYRAKQLWGNVKPDPDAFDELVQIRLDAMNGKSRFQPLDSAAIAALASSEWRVKGVFPSRGVVSIFGPSKAGKSFLVINMACAIAEGESFFGYRTNAAPVLYVVLEGGDGFKLRVKAWEAHNGRQLPASFRAVIQGFTLTDERDLRELARICPKGCVVFIDTLNRATPGMDENSGKDMGEIIAAASRLQELIDGLVVLVAHTGKDAEKGVRGHSSLPAALDGAINVNRTETGRTFKIDKVKDGADGKEHEFRLDVVSLGKDKDGDEITSCVVIPEGAQYASQGMVQISPRMQHRFAMQTFLVLLHKYTQQGRPVVETKAHIEFSKHPECNGVTTDAFKTAKELLLAEGVIEVVKEPNQPMSKARNVLRERLQQ
jgi:hypothetical protein